MISSQFGEIVEEEWFRTSQIRPNIKLDAFVIMPNHLHGIIMIYDAPVRRGTLQRAPALEQFGKPVSNSIPTIVRLFKSATTKRINEIRKTPKWPVWQRNYYEHIIRNENDLYRIRDYVICNPLNWVFDEENR